MAMLDHRLLLAHDYAIINPLQVDADTWRDLPVEVLAPKPFSSQPELMPRLLDMTAMDTAARVALLDRSEQWEAEEATPWFSALLATQASPSHIRRHLADALAVRQRDGTHNLFRYFDHDVTRHFAWLLSPEQLDQLLGPITQWTWRFAKGDWRSLQPAALATVPLRLSPDQQQTLIDLDELNGCLRTLARTEPARVQDDALVQSVRDELAKAAVVAGLQEPNDRKLFALQAVRFHPRIHQHPELATRLGEVRAGESSNYTVACRDLDDNAMRRMVAELASGREET